jgi:hypothetical protein
MPSEIFEDHKPFVTCISIEASPGSWPEPVFRDFFSRNLALFQRKKNREILGFWRKAIPTGNICEISHEMPFGYGVHENLPAR